MSELERELWPAVRLGQIAFLYGEEGTALAYCVWAFLTPEVARDYAADRGRGLTLAEWNEGTDLWIIDVVAPFGHCGSLSKALKAILPTSRSAFGVRRDRPNLPTRIVRVGW